MFWNGTLIDLYLVGHQNGIQHHLRTCAWLASAAMTLIMLCIQILAIVWADVHIVCP